MATQQALSVATAKYNSHFKKPNQSEVQELGEGVGVAVQAKAELESTEQAVTRLEHL